MRKERTSHRLRLIMAERGLRQIDILNAAAPFCEKYGVKLNKSDLSQYLSGKNEPKQEKLTILGLALNVSEAWLMGYDVSRDREIGDAIYNAARDAVYIGEFSELTQEEKIAALASVRPTLPPDALPVNPTRIHQIPILGRISAGLPLYAEEQVEGYTLTDLNGGAEYFALRVKGDSMDALGIKDGYMIIVRRQEQVENGEVAVIMVGSEDATVKRFHASGETVTLMPQSTNPAHLPQIYNIRQTPIRVLGKVVEVKFTL